MAFMKGQRLPFEGFFPGEWIYNYNLTADDLTEEDIDYALFASRHNGSPNFDQHPFKVYDLVKIEESAGEIYLSDVFNILSDSGRFYPRMHAAFCRGEYGYSDKGYSTDYNHSHFQEKYSPST